MTLVKYRKPQYNLFSNRFSSIMDEFFRDIAPAGDHSFIPGIDISETDEQFLISAEIPGVKKEEINIDLEEGRLTISGKRSFQDEEEGKTFHRVETRYGSFNRSFQLPDNVDEENITASYKDGLLNITINKTEEKTSKKQIEIS